MHGYVNVVKLAPAQRKPEFAGVHTEIALSSNSWRTPALCFLYVSLSVINNT
jgi:hypothetical protein